MSSASPECPYVPRFHVPEAGAPFQTILVPLEANTAPEELDDLGASLLPMFIKPSCSRANCSTFAEFPGTDEKVDRAIAAIEVRKERL